MLVKNKLLIHMICICTYQYSLLHQMLSSIWHTHRTSAMNSIRFEIISFDFHVIFLSFSLGFLANIEKHMLAKEWNDSNLFAKHVTTAAELKSQPNKQLQHSPSIKINWSYRRMCRTQTHIICKCSKANEKYGGKRTENRSVINISCMNITRSRLD